MQQGEHEIISDDGLMQLYFTQVDASNELLPAHWHEHLEMICMHKGCQTSFRKRKVQAVNHLEQFRPPLESKQLQNLFLFIGLAENCIRQRR